MPPPPTRGPAAGCRHPRQWIARAARRRARDGDRAGSLPHSPTWDACVVHPPRGRRGSRSAGARAPTLLLTAAACARETTRIASSAARATLSPTSGRAGACARASGRGRCAVVAPSVARRRARQALQPMAARSARTARRDGVACRFATRVARPAQAESPGNRPRHRSCRAASQRRGSRAPSTYPWRTRCSAANTN